MLIDTNDKQPTANPAPDLGLGLGLGLEGGHDPDPVMFFGHCVEHTHGMSLCRFHDIRCFYF